MTYIHLIQASSDGTVEELLDKVEHLDDIQHEAIDKADALAEAQGQQQNEISRYLHELGEVMDADRKNHFSELLTLHEDIGRIRDDLSKGPGQTEVRVIPPEPAPPVPPKAISVTGKAPTAVPPPAPTPAPAPAAHVEVNVAPPQPPLAAVMSISEHSDGASPPLFSREFAILHLQWLWLIDECYATSFAARDGERCNSGHGSAGSTGER